MDIRRTRAGRRSMVTQFSAVLCVRGDPPGSSHALAAEAAGQGGGSRTSQSAIPRARDVVEAFAQEGLAVSGPQAGVGARGWRTVCGAGTPACSCDVCARPAWVRKQLRKIDKPLSMYELRDTFERLQAEARRRIPVQRGRVNQRTGSRGSQGLILPPAGHVRSNRSVETSTVGTQTDRAAEGADQEVEQAGMFPQGAAREDSHRRRGFLAALGYMRLPLRRHSATVQPSPT
uniref:Uncharacterized protein n=1 Tax=Alexandrium monilatum TaxID=311494 RepID=A0A7S4Q8R9_9DINO